MKAEFINNLKQGELFGRLSVLALGLIVFATRPVFAEEKNGAARKEELTKQAQTKQATEVGGATAKKVLEGVKEKLTAEMAKDLVQSIGFCHENAIPLTKEFEKNNSQVTAIKRTSLKLRNPSNKPDEHEEAILKKWEKETPPEFVVEYLSANEIRYYRPLKVQTMCLTCHGNPDGKLKEAIKAKYPEDKATGYKEGDLRGLIRISLKPIQLSK